MKNKIVKGLQEKPMCVLAYGPKGLGKTSLAAQFPKPLLIDIEGGAKYINIDKYPCKTFADVIEALTDAIKDTEYKTIAIDSLDWLESLIFTAIKEKYKTDSIEKAAGGYGKAYKEVLDLNVQIKNLLEKIIDSGKHVFLIAHPRVVNFNNPLTESAYDKYELKLYDSKNTSVKDFWTEYVDAMFFINADTFTTGEGKEARADSGDLYLYTKNSPAYDAKRRVKMPDKIKFVEEGMFDVIHKHLGPQKDLSSLYVQTLEMAEAMTDLELRKDMLSKLPQYRNNEAKLNEIQKYIQGVK